MTNFVETLKANRKRIIKNVVIASAVVATVVVVGALYKANVDANAALEVGEELAK